MKDDWFNINDDEDFDPDDHGIEMDEIAKIHAIADMKESQQKWARKQAEEFYKDFETLDILLSVKSILKMIRSNELELTNVNLMLNNMIEIFKETEDYEKCHICLKIKEGINDKI